MTVSTKDELTQLEREMIDLRKKLMSARKKQPPEPVDDYTLTKADGTKVTLASLFGDKKNLIVIYNMGESCPYCTLWADGFNGVTKHLEDRAAFVVVSPDDPQTQAEFAAGRGWTFRMLSGQGSDFTRDMGFEPEPGKPWPGVSAFHKKDDGTIVRTATAPFGPGDEFCATWHLFDLLADGANDWSPKYSY